RGRSPEPLVEVRRDLADGARRPFLSEGRDLLRTALRIGGLRLRSVSCRADFLRLLIGFRLSRGRGGARRGGAGRWFRHRGFSDRRDRLGVINDDLPPRADKGPGGQHQRNLQREEILDDRPEAAGGARKGGTKRGGNQPGDDAPRAAAL